MTEHPRPIAESYWVETGRLLAGEYPGRFDQELTRKRLNALIEAGLDTYIDLTQPNEIVPYTSVLFEEAQVYDMQAAYHRFPIGDFSLPTSNMMNAILDQMEESLKAGRRIYLHCWGGIGRTGTTVSCYLVRQGKSADEALDQLSAWWRTVPKSQYHPHSPETREQVDFIRTWAAHDHRLRTT
jgi:hypothetical protein